LRAPPILFLELPLTFKFEFALIFLPEVLVRCSEPPLSISNRFNLSLKVFE
jgi:hypothetical protein